MRRILLLVAGMAAALVHGVSLADTCNNCVIYYEPNKREIHHDWRRHDMRPGHRRHWKESRVERDRHVTRYEPVRARVIDVEPVYRYQSFDDSYSSCIYRDEHGDSYRSWTPIVLGAVIGGAAGHRLGDSYGDADAAAVAGGLLGAVIGRDVGRHNQESRRISVRGPCRELPGQRYRREPVEYVVSYRYNGQVYRAHMDYHPGEWVELDDRQRPL